MGLRQQPFTLCLGPGRFHNLGQTVFFFFFLVHFVLEDVEVVGGRHGDDVLMRMPRRVEDLLAEVQAVYADLILATFPTYTHLEGRGTVRRFYT